MRIDADRCGLDDSMKQVNEKNNETNNLTGSRASALPSVAKIKINEDQSAIEFRRLGRHVVIFLCLRLVRFHAFPHKVDAVPVRWRHGRRDALPVVLL